MQKLALRLTSRSLTSDFAETQEGSHNLDLFGGAVLALHFNAKCVQDQAGAKTQVTGWLRRDEA